MPPIRKIAKHQYKWTCGGIRGISHVELIAHGGFGEVHKMLDQRTKEFFARKIIRPLGDKVTPKDIDNEAKAISTLCSPGRNKHIIVVHGHDWLPRQAGSYYIDMEYCDETLASRLQRRVPVSAKDVVDRKALLDEAGRARQDLRYGTATLMGPDNPGASGSSGLASAFDWESVLYIIEHIVYGLIYIHDEGVVHRDLKPANVLFSKKDNCWKLADFGTASHATSKRLNTTRDSRGTAGYRAPETLDEDDARFNQKSDIFALGCILYELVTGEKLFTNDWASLTYSKTGELPKSVWWPASLTLERNRLNAFEVLVSSMIQVHPSSRPNAREVQNSLASIRIGDCIAPQPKQSSQRPIQRYLSDPKTERPTELEIPGHHGFPRQLPFLREVQNMPTLSSSREEFVRRPGNLPTFQASVQQRKLTLAEINSMLQAQRQAQLQQFMNTLTEEQKTHFLSLNSNQQKQFFANWIIERNNRNQRFAFGLQARNNS